MEGSRPLPAGDRESLEEERDFLLTSLADLEAEYAAGDIEDHDFAALRDDYTARTAAVLRAIEQASSPPDAAADDPRDPKEGTGLGRRVAVIAGVLAFAVLAGVLVAQAVGRRDPGESVTGDIRATVASRLNEAGRLAAEGDYDGALSRYDEVLADQPGNAEALTYSGWVLTLSGERSQGLSRLIDAATANPDYPDVHAFLAIVFLRGGLVDEAERELDLLESLDPPAGVVELVEGLRSQIAAARDESS